MTLDGKEEMEMLRDCDKNRILINRERRDHNELAQKSESKVGQHLPSMILSRHVSSPSNSIQQPTQMIQNVEGREIEKILETKIRRQKINTQIYRYVKE